MGQAVGGNDLAVDLVGIFGDDIPYGNHRKLGDLVDPSVCIVQQTAATGIDTGQCSADAKLLHVEAHGLVFPIPLLLKGAQEFPQAAQNLGVVLLCKPTKGFLDRRFGYGHPDRT